MSSDDPDSEKLVVDDFPRKLNFEVFDGLLKPSLKYRPENTGRWSTSDFYYGDQDQEAVIKRLQKVKKLVETIILPWVNSITEESELSQITKLGEQVWCEKRWIEDYKEFLSTQTR